MPLRITPSPDESPNPLFADSSDLLAQPDSRRCMALLWLWDASIPHGNRSISHPTLKAQSTIRTSRSIPRREDCKARAKHDLWI